MAAPFITVDWLKKKEACEDQVALFEKTWPNGVQVSLEALTKASRLKLNLYWFAEKALSAEARGVYVQALRPIRTMHDEMLVAATKRFKVATLKDRKEYDRKINLANRAYIKATSRPSSNETEQKRIKDRAEKEYRATIKAAWKKYKQNTARFDGAYNKFIGPVINAYTKYLSGLIWECGNTYGWRE